MPNQFHDSRDHRSMLPMRGVAACLALLLQVAANADSAVPATGAATSANTTSTCEPIPIRVREDSRGTLASVRELMKDLRLPSVAEAAERAVEQSQCLMLHESWHAAEPVTVPILRIRVQSLKVAEKSIAEKADVAIRRYVGSYIGQTRSQDDVHIEEVTVVAELMCPTRKTVQQAWTATDEGLGSAKTSRREVAIPVLDANAERVAWAVNTTVNAAMHFLVANPKHCHSGASRSAEKGTS